MDANEELVWKRLVQLWIDNSALPSAAVLAEMCNVSTDYAQSIIDRIGTPREVLESGQPERVKLLQRGIELTAGSRDKTYGPPYNNLTACACMWRAYIGAKHGEYAHLYLDAEDVAHMMQLVKMTRTFYGGYHADNYTDNATYGAIAGECREIEERE